MFHPPNEYCETINLFEEKYPNIHLSDFVVLQETFDKCFTQNIPASKKNHVDHDNFFNCYYHYWQTLVDKGYYVKATKIMELLIDSALLFENNDKERRIHKGTPYYRAASSCILNDELEKGFLYMHQAYDEDKKTHDITNPNSPAFKFIILDASKGQALRRLVTEMEKKVEFNIKNFDTTYSFQEFQHNFLKSDTLREAVFYFVYTFFRIRKISNISSNYRSNEFSSLLLTSILFDITRITEIVIKNKTSLDPKHDLYYDQLIELSKKEGILFLESCNKVQAYFNGTETKKGKNPNEIFKILLNPKVTRISVRNVKRIQKDIFISYKIRNIGAHQLTNMPIIYEKYNEMIQSVLNVLFYAVKMMY